MCAAGPMTIMSANTRADAPTVAAGILRFALLVWPCHAALRTPDDGSRRRSSLRTASRCLRKASALIGGGSTWTGRVIAWSRSLKAAMAALRASEGCDPAASSMAANPRRRMVSIGSSGGPSACGPATGTVFAAQSIGETVVTGVPSAGGGGRGTDGSTDSLVSTSRDARAHDAGEPPDRAALSNARIRSARAGATSSSSPRMSRTTLDCRGHRRGSL